MMMQVHHFPACYSLSFPFISKIMKYIFDITGKGYRYDMENEKGDRD